jgi:hypothetical protein
MNYLIIANTYLVLFYIFYYLLLSKETFFQWNRIYLIGSTGLSFLLPMVHLDWLQDLFKTSTVMIARTNLDTVTIYGSPAQAEVTESGLLNLPVWIYFYATGCLVSIILLIRRAILLKRQLRITKAGEAYSFMHIIHVDKTQEGCDAILNHEQVHANQYHTVDVLFFELVKVFAWFNPVVYYLSKSAKLTHEYIADEAVNKSNDEKIAYAELLISRTFSISSKLLANNFLDHSFVKSRVKMLFKDKSRRTASLKYLLIVPLFFCMLIFSSAKVSEVKDFSGNNKSLKHNQLSDYTDIQSINIDSWGAKNWQNDDLKEEDNLGNRMSETTIKLDTTSSKKVQDFNKVDVQPAFPGGMHAFYTWIGENYKYSQEAKKNQVNGTIAVSFIVERDGALSSFKILRDLGYGTGEEAINLLKKSPKWKPGLIKGEPVRVSYSLPIRLNLVGIKDSLATKSMP